MQPTDSIVPPPVVSGQPEAKPRRALTEVAITRLALDVLRADAGVPNNLEFTLALGSAINDLLNFAKGEISRMDLEDSIKAYALWIYEMQDDCPACKGAQGLKDLCIPCKGLGWVWKNR